MFSSSRLLFRIGFIVILLTVFITESFAQSVDLDADAHTRASQAITIAKANGTDIGEVTAAQLGDVIEAMETGQFADSNTTNSGVAVAMSSSTKRYKCSKTNWYAGHGLTINWWADGRVSSGRIREITNTGYNWTWLTWIPTLDAVVNATVTAHIRNSGRKVKIYIDGTVKYWFAGLPISTRALNESCTKNA
ncbi:MAG: hypothetical protein OXI30_15830 [Chloroflexota bacterium]|nr:hypothetical protein [Chloroflexota bacterium]